MHIMTKDGWKQLSPRECTAPGHTPTLLEREGIPPGYEPTKAMAEYANAFGNGVYFEYFANGTTKQIKPAIHPLRGMF